MSEGCFKQLTLLQEWVDTLNVGRTPPLTNHILAESALQEADCVAQPVSGARLLIKTLMMGLGLLQRRARQLREASEAEAAVQREAELSERLKQVRASQQEKQRAEAERKAQQVRLTGSLDWVRYLR
jgi:hypothetical protein